MKRITASEARRQWFRLLDEVVAGEVVVLERKGRRVVLRREDIKVRQKEPPEIDYRKLLRVPDADHADQWTWEWQGEEKDLTLAKRGS
jgi:antitoxin (DNA-binding transcriptional repressor) of toxin-antitoxin stability system